LFVDFFVRFEPLPEKEMEFRDELLRDVETTRAQIGLFGCPSIGLREPFAFAIHSEWGE
jgi:hypothetical protein